MKIDINVDYCFETVAHKVKDVSKQDWEFLIRNVLKAKGKLLIGDKEPYSIRVMEGVKSVWNKYEEKEYEFAEEELINYYVKIWDDENNKTIAAFHGINVEDYCVSGNEELKDKLELVWRKFLILVKGNSFANVIVDEIKKQEDRKIREIKEKSEKEINKIEDFVQTQKTVD